MHNDILLEAIDICFNLSHHSSEYSKQKRIYCIFTKYSFLNRIFFPRYCEIMTIIIKILFAIIFALGE